MFGEIVGTAIGYNENKQNNRWNAEQAQKQREWEANMANTAHQREVRDLQLAGLNPVLAAGGSGAATGAGAVASGTAYNPDLGGIDNQILTGLGLLMTKEKNDAEIKNINEDTIQKAKQGGKTDAEIKRMELQNIIDREITDAQTALLKAQNKTERAEAQKRLTEAQNAKRELDHAITEGTFEGDNKYRKIGKQTWSDIKSIWTALSE